MMNIEREKDAYLGELLERDAITQDEFKDLVFKPEINAFHSNYLSSRFMDNINFGWSAWQAAKAQAVPEWISAEDELPKRNLNVLLNLVVRKNGKPIKCIGFYSIEPGEESCFVLDDNFTVLKGVTHWMPLPDSPKSQEQKG